MIDLIIVLAVTVAPFVATWGVYTLCSRVSD
jgi:hypothetical protein